MAKKFNLADYVKPAERSDSDHDGEVLLLPITQIRPNARNFYTMDGIDELADSIEVNGLIHPLVVYPGAGILYTVLSGHRRLRALQALRLRPGHEHDFDLVPCSVRSRPADRAHEDLMLIHANSTGRVRSPAEMAEEAKRLTSALIELKKQGTELPGRLRDAVADAMGVSSSKLGRIQAIENNLRVPGFKQAWKDGKLPEAAAYELSQLNEADQYAALDLLIDEGVNYEKADIKAVQHIKKRVALGESPTQDLAAKAEKLGIPIRDGDYSPLFAHFVRQAVPESWQQGLRGCTRAQGIEHLHRWGFGHPMAAGGAVEYRADPQGITLSSPIGKRLKWSEVWELLAMSALAEDRAADSRPYKGTAAEPMTAPEGWSLCSKKNPPEGQLVCILWDEGDGCEDWFAHVAIYTGGQYMEFGWSTISVDVPDGAIWAPLAGNWRELGTKAKQEANR